MKIVQRVFATAVVCSLGSPALAGPPHVARLPEPVRVKAVPKSHVADARMPDGRIIVSVRLNSSPIWSSTAQVGTEQAGFLERCLQLPGVEVIARTRHVLNAVFLAVDPQHIEDIASDPAVSKVVAVADYVVDLDETVPYIGAAAVQAKGIDGSGVRVAVFDSGIDYLHADLGGSGDPAEFAANDPNVIEPGTFPTAKVVGGADFVGSEWPAGPLLPDADPIDDGPARGHGTHVADIIGGEKGVAPGTLLYSVKVCSSVGSSCSGVALLQGMEFSVDPNGDGDTSDRVDIINMSLGRDFGHPFDDDLVAAIDNATALGVFTVASAGNGGDRPYVTGTPAGARTALSVAQTTMPSAIFDQMEVTVPESSAGLYPAPRQTWSGMLSEPISGPVTYADGAGGNLNGCAAFEAGTLAGQIVFVDRGGCAFSDKIRNIENAGGILGIIGLITPGDPFFGGFGGGDPISIPGFMITQAAGDILRTGTAVITIDPANGAPYAGAIIPSSARGPSNGDNNLKPEIGAPGGSISAVAGSGTGTEGFSGTSGASPMVAGAAALLLESRPSIPPWEAKALLMNFARLSVTEGFFGVPAAISRIGAGEVDVTESFLSRTLVYTMPDQEAKISLGYEEVSRRRQAYRVNLQVRNDSDQRRRIRVTHDFRNRADADSAAVSVRHPNYVTVGPNSTRDFTVRFVVFGEKLPSNSMTSGSSGNDPDTLSATEYDGFLMFEDEIDYITVPWHIIPRKSADVRANTNLRFRDGQARVRLRNRGVETAQNEAFSLLAVSPNLPEGGPGENAPTPDIRAVGIRTSTVPAGFCFADPSFVVELAFQSWEPQSQLLPVSYFADLDMDGDGDVEYRIFNEDLSELSPPGTGLDGQNVVFVLETDTNEISAVFFAEHATNTRNAVLTVCAEQLGLTLEDYGTREATVTFGAEDVFFLGPGDVTQPVNLTFGAERFVAEVSDVPPNSRGEMTVLDRGIGPDLGVLLMTNADRGPGQRGGATAQSETLLFLSAGARMAELF